MSPWLAFARFWGRIHCIDLPPEFLEAESEMRFISRTPKPMANLLNSFPTSINLMRVNLTQIKFHLQNPPVPREIIVLFLSYLSLRLLQTNGLGQITLRRAGTLVRRASWHFSTFPLSCKKEISLLSWYPCGVLIKRFECVFGVLISFS